MTLTRSPETSEASPARIGGRLWPLAVGALVVLIAVNTGWQIVAGSQLAMVLPIALVVGIALCAIALWRFEVFIVVTLAIRASVDLTRAGATERTEGAGSSGPGAAVLAALVILAGVLWLVAWHRKRQAAAPPLEIALLMFLATAAVSVLGSRRPVTSAAELARISAVVVMFLVLRRMLGESRAQTDRILIATFVSAVIPIIVAAMQVRGEKGLFLAGGFSRVRGPFVHPNPFALYLTLLIIMGVALAPHVKGRLAPWLIGLLAGCGVCLLLTYTRTGWLAVVVGLMVVGALKSRWLVGGVLVSVLIVLVAVPSVIGRFADLSQETRASGTAGNSLVWRFAYWQEALALAKDNPLTGIGLKMTQSSTVEGKEPHNDFVRAYAETGTIGLLAYLGLLAALVATATRAVRTAGRGRDRAIAVGFAGCVAAFMLVSLASNVMSQVVILWYFFAFAAAALSVTRVAAPITD